MKETTMETATVASAKESKIHRTTLTLLLSVFLSASGTQAGVLTVPVKIAEKIAAHGGDNVAEHVASHYADDAAKVATKAGCKTVIHEAPQIGRSVQNALEVARVEARSAEAGVGVAARGSRIPAGTILAAGLAGSALWGTHQISSGIRNEHEARGRGMENKPETQAEVREAEMRPWVVLATNGAWVLGAIMLLYSLPGIIGCWLPLFRRRIPARAIESRNAGTMSDHATADAA